MAIVDCSCRGINPECEKCEGKGYYDTENIDKKPFVNISKTKKEDEKKFSDLISALSPTELKKQINSIILMIDNKSQAKKKNYSKYTFQC